MAFDREWLKKTSIEGVVTTAGTAAGGISAAAVGATIGTLFAPGPGTAIGMWLGGLAGGFFGGKAALDAAKKFNDGE